MTKEMVEQIIVYAKTNNVTEKEAQKILFGTHTRLSRYKRKYNIPVHKPNYYIKDNYFTELTLENCYWAGFIAADGYISKDQSRLIIGLSRKDTTHLQKFLNSLETNYTLRPSSKNSIYLDVKSKQIVSDLYSHFNITNAKSYTLKSPNLVDETFIDAYIIGLIDGDGSIHFSTPKGRQKILYISLVGTPEVLTFVKNRFEEILGNSTSKLHHDKKFKRNTCTYTISCKNARRIFEHFYNLPIYKLNRKWSSEKHNFCINYKKSNCPLRQKGVNVFNANGELIWHFNTLKEASLYTGVSYGRISSMCLLDDGQHIAHEYMFSRKNTIPKYIGNPHDKTSKFYKKDEN